MDNTAGCRDIGCLNHGVFNRHKFSGLRQRDIGAVNRFAIAVLDVCCHDLAWYNVLGQNCFELGGNGVSHRNWSAGGGATSDLRCGGEEKDDAEHEHFEIFPNGTTPSVGLIDDTNMTVS